ncbi:MAG: MFS transporter [Acidimicrobiales bacterium]
MTDLGVGTPYPADRSLLGDRAAWTLLPVQAFHSAGEALFALSLVGSLFFNVSVDAARPRILLYLALTMAPFAVLAPLIGPVIDKLRGGHRAVLLLTLGGRAAVALLLASQLKTLLLYPQAFVIVVLAKVYTVGRNALIPSMVADRDHLVVVNSRLARAGATSGVVAVGIGLAVLQLGGADWVLRTAALFYAAGAVSALAIRGHRTSIDTSPVVETTEMHGPGIHSATMAMAGLRMATGFVLFHVGFALKTSGQPTWLVAAVLGIGSLGGFGGTFVAPWLHRRWDEQRVLTAALLLPALLASLAALRFHGSTAMALSISLGLAGSVGRRAFDGVVQTQAPHATRGRAYAGLETRLEVAWVIGSIMAVLARFPNWVGLAILSLALGAFGFSRIVDELTQPRFGVYAEMATLPARLLATAEAVAAQGDRQQAVLVALAAAEAAAMAGTVTDEQLDDLKKRSRQAAVDNDPAVEEDVLRLAYELVTESSI